MITPVFGVIQTSTKELSMNKLFTTILLSAFASASFASTPNLAPATGEKAAPKAAAKAKSPLARAFGVEVKITSWFLLF